MTTPMATPIKKDDAAIGHTRESILSGVRGGGMGEGEGEGEREGEREGEEEEEEAEGEGSEDEMRGAEKREFRLRKRDDFE